MLSVLSYVEKEQARRFDPDRVLILALYFFFFLFLQIGLPKMIFTFSSSDKIPDCKLCVEQNYLKTLSMYQLFVMFITCVSLNIQSILKIFNYAVGKFRRPVTCTNMANPPFGG